MTDGPQIQYPAGPEGGLAGAFIVGGSWEDEPAALEEKPAPEFPDPFAT
ncbi:hypothetical protein VA596_41660 [Amycolatopsis sp., V23-08]|uniref:Uncharacterized protein n=1 Tax=Amycolatopsis heterodermiae TaxID=3110235 RepID=A0ABU5RKJ9_9PSEU|nr:hypothetical protein [Amycolatopsis sp., V23-08]MEA5366094.1 hypothetical protein [Amycolatopsis sp., V23-08]